MISASSLQRIAVCPSSESLPHAKSVSEASEYGTAIHGYLAAVTLMAPEEALLLVPEEHRAACAAIDVSKLPACDPSAYAAEVAFAYNTENDTAREIGRATNRDYSGLSYREIPGTADVVGVADDAVIIADYKTGWGDVTKADKNWQLRFLALAACRAYGKDRAIVAIIRLREDSAPYFDTAEFDAMDLSMIADELGEIVRRADPDFTVKGTETFTTGSHCRYCPAYAYCPANTQMVVALGTAPAEIEAQFGSMLTPETAAEAWKRLKTAKALVERMDAMIRTYATQTPIDLGGGTILGETTVTSDVMDGGVAHKVLSDLHGIAIADRIIEISVSKTRMEEVLKPFLKTQGLKYAPALRDIMATVEASGGLRHSSRKSVREHKA